MAIHSQLLSTASEVAAAVEGMMRHATAMKAEGNYVDSHGQSEIGFGLTRILGYDLLPRIKQIKKVNLYRPGREDEDTYDNLADAMTRPIRWDVIENNYDQLIKYATAIRVGTASTKAIPRHFTCTASTPSTRPCSKSAKPRRLSSPPATCATTTSARDPRGPHHRRGLEQRQRHHLLRQERRTPPNAVTSKNSRCGPSLLWCPRSGDALGADA